VTKRKSLITTSPGVRQVLAEDPGRDGPGLLWLAFLA